MLECALGGLGWRPADFWRATPIEFIAAIEGREATMGQADDEIDWEWFERMKKKYPDVKPQREEAGR